MTPDQIVNFVYALADARSRDDRAAQIDLLDGLLRGPRRNSLNVALTLAGTAGAGIDLEPGEMFHRLQVERVAPDGTTSEGSVADLRSPHVATFGQMVVALNNDDKAMATDLFLGFVGDDGCRALSVLVYGLKHVLHRFGACGCQQCDDA